MIFLLRGFDDHRAPGGNCSSSVRTKNAFPWWLCFLQSWTAYQKILFPQISIGAGVLGILFFPRRCFVNAVFGIRRYHVLNALFLRPVYAFVDWQQVLN